MAAISIITEPHYSRVADYRADGYTLEQYLQDHAYQCSHCGSHFDEVDDGLKNERTGQWFCEPCIDIGEYKGSLTWV